MAKPQKARARRPPPADAPPTAPVAPAPKRPVPTTIAPAPAASYWFDFRLPWSQLATARFALFAILALDAFLQLRHAPRYGAGDFNVAHLRWLDELAPGRTGMVVAQSVLCGGFVALAVGLAGRIVGVAVAAIYAWTYLSSHLDSYQHHYLVLLILIVAAAFDWRRPAAATGATEVTAWPIRLIVGLIAIMYLWAAVAKLEPGWLDGTALALQIQRGPAASALGVIGMPLAAKLIVVTELALGLGLWWRRAWPWLALLGFAFHAGILFSDLEIGLFAWLMLALYLLVLPSRLFTWSWQALRLDAGRARLATEGRRLQPWWLAVPVALVAAAALALSIRVDGVALGFALAVGLFAVDGLVSIRGTRSLAASSEVGRGWASRTALVAVIISVAGWSFDRASTVAVDHYRFWAGAARRLGDTDTAWRAYQHLRAIEPSNSAAHYHLGRLALRPGVHFDPALGQALLERAAVLEPTRARALIELARAHRAAGDQPAAAQALQDALAREPANPDAQALQGADASPPPPPSDAE